MSRYKITQEEFKVISELKNRFGNVPLLDLYNQSTVIDANGNVVTKTPTSIEEACKTLTDKQIEKLLHEKVSNMCIYAHYDLTEHKAGLLSPHYNGQKVEFLADNAEPKMIKSALEARIHEIKLVATAVKTIQRADFSGHNGYSFMPVYDRRSPLICGNIIFRNRHTGKFHAMNAWVCNHPTDDVKLASSWGLNQFMCYAAKFPYFQNKVLTQLSDTLLRARLQR